MDWREPTYHDKAVSPIIKTPFPRNVQDPSGVGLGQEIGRVACDDGEEDVRGEMGFEEMCYWRSVLVLVTVHSLTCRFMSMTISKLGICQGGKKERERKISSRTQSSAYTMPCAFSETRGSP